jgi:hypothetical protein
MPQWMQAFYSIQLPHSGTLQKGHLYYSTPDRLLKKEENINSTVFKIILTHIHSKSNQMNQMQFAVVHSSNDYTKEHKYHQNNDTNQVKHQEGQHVNWFLLQTDNQTTSAPTK